MVYPKHITTKNAKETTKIGQEIGLTLLTSLREGSTHSTIICLYGTLGSGKTTFVQGLSQGIGLHQRLLSPTFIIVRRYSLTQEHSFLYHLDLYRVSGVTQLDSLGIGEILHNPHAVVIIEWADRLGPLLPNVRVDITFTINDDNSHTLDFQEYK